MLKDEDGIAKWLLNIAEREIEQDQVKESGKHIEEAMRILNNRLLVKSTEKKALALRLASYAYLLKGRLMYLITDFSASKIYFNQALQYARDSVNKKEEILALIMIGHLARQKKEYDEAYQNFQMAGVLAAEISDTELENECFSHLGLISRRKGDFEDAKERFTQVYENAKRMGNRRVEQTNLNLIGDIYLRLGEYQKAEPYFREALEISKKYAIGQGIRICIGQLAEVLINLKHYSEANELLVEIDRLSDHAQDGISIAWTRRRKGMLLNALGKTDKGDEYIQLGIQKLRELGNEDYISDFESVLSSNNPKYMCN